MTDTSLPSDKVSAKRLLLVVIIASVLISMLSVAARYHLINTRPLAGRLDGQEPEAHIIVTEMAFDQTAWKVHRFLPIFTLGDRYNKHIDQHPGAATSDKYGNYFYTSTPPLTFLLPYLVAKLTVGSPSVESMRWYNVSLNVAASAAIGILVLLCLKNCGANLSIQILVALTAALIYMTAPECLKSHTINLWAQQFYAFLLIVQLVVFLFFPSRLLLFVLAALGCLADWTPYLANIAMASIALYSYWRTKDTRSLYVAVAIIAGCVVGGLGMIAWFSTVMPVQQYFANLQMRAGNRSFQAPGSSIIYFLPQYARSLGLFTAIGFGALLLKPWSNPRDTTFAARRVILPDTNPLLISLFVVTFGLVENVIMADHALHYSYDRLKGVQFLALLVAWAASRSYRNATRLFGVSFFAGLASIGLFWFSYDTPQGWNFVAHAQQERIGAVIYGMSSPDGPAFFNGEIRGSEVYYARRNVFEQVDKIAEDQGLDPVSFVRQWCLEHQFVEGTLYEISGDYPNPSQQDIPRTLRVRRVFTDGEISDLGTVLLSEAPSDYHQSSVQRLQHLQAWLAHKVSVFVQPGASQVESTQSNRTRSGL